MNEQPCQKPARGHLTPTEAGERLSYSNWKVRKMCELGKFPGAYRDGPSGHWRIPVGDVEAFLDAQRSKVLKRKRPT